MRASNRNFGDVDERMSSKARRDRATGNAVVYRRDKKQACSLSSTHERAAVRIHSCRQSVSVRAADRNQRNRAHGGTGLLLDESHACSDPEAFPKYRRRPS